MNHQKAMLIVSFGTTYLSAQKAIEQIEQTLKNQFAEYDFYRAFTSTMVISKLKKTKNIHVDTPQEAIEKLYQAGYQEVICQSLHIIPGIEYEKMCNQLSKYADCFEHFSIGKPMLYQQQDYEFVITQVMKYLPTPQNGEALVFMGHGSEHFSNSAYSQLENLFYFLNYPRVFVGTVEGFPTLDYIIKRLKEHHISKIYLTPFMIVTGDHAQNDLAGDGADSWKSMLENAGFEVEVILKGLGEYPEIGELFSNHFMQSKRSPYHAN